MSNNGNTNRVGHILEVVLLISIALLLIQQFVYYVEVVQRFSNTSLEVTTIVIGFVIGIVVFLYIQNRLSMLTIPVIYILTIFISWSIILYYYFNPPKADLEIYNNCVEVSLCSSYYTEFIIVNKGDLVARDVNITIKLHDIGLFGVEYFENEGYFSIGSSSWQNDIDDVEDFKLEIFPESIHSSISIVTREKSDSKYRHLLGLYSPKNAYLVNVANLSVGESIRIRINAPVNIITETNEANNTLSTQGEDINRIKEYQSSMQINFRSDSAMANNLQKDVYRERKTELLTEEVIREVFLHSGSFIVTAVCADCKSNPDYIAYLPTILSVRAIPCDKEVYGSITCTTYPTEPSTYTVYAEISYYSRRRILPEQWDIPLNVRLHKFSVNEIKDVMVLNSIYMHYINWDNNTKEIVIGNEVDADWQLENEYSFGIIVSENEEKVAVVVNCNNGLTMDSDSKVFECAQNW